MKKPKKFTIQHGRFTVDFEASLDPSCINIVINEKYDLIDWIVIDKKEAIKLSNALDKFIKYIKED